MTKKQLHGTMTLAAIRAQSPCADGWTKLLKSLGTPPLDTIVSLGDIARSNGAADVWWCVRCLDWSDIAVRRAVIGALLPTLRRAGERTTDPRVHECLGAVAAWQAGDDSVDLRAAWAAAQAAAAAAAEEAVAEEDERDRKRDDLIRAFPPLHPERLHSA